MASVIGSAILRTQTDERLVALARTGHGRAFEAISERYRAELTRCLRRILPPGSVEDALQQTNLQAWKALSGGTEVRELRAWLHEIARNAARGVASRGYDYDELKEALLVTPGPEQDLERREAVRRALRGVAELPERQREALLAVAVGGRSHAEVALDLGITDTAARQLVRRARVSLLAMSSVAVPPQLVLWAARAGHSALVGKAAAGTGAGKAAAGTGLGGGLAGSALKVGAVAVTVGGVAVGVAPIRQALAPPRPAHVARHHRHHAPRTEAIQVAALTTGLDGGRPPPGGARADPVEHSAVRPTRRRHSPSCPPDQPGGDRQDRGLGDLAEPDPGRRSGPGPDSGGDTGEHRDGAGGSRGGGRRLVERRRQDGPGGPGGPGGGRELRAERLAGCLVARPHPRWGDTALPDGCAGRGR